MLSTDFIRKNKKLVEENIERRGFDPKQADVKKFIELDDTRRQILKNIEKVNRKRNLLSKKFQESEDKDAVRKEGESLKAELQKHESALRKCVDKLQEIHSWIPNILSEDTPDGKGEDDNVEIKTWKPQTGYLPEDQLGKSTNKASREFMPSLDFDGKDHIELGSELGIVDIERAAEVSGSRFYYLLNEAVLIQYALFEMLFSELRKRDFVPFIPPLMVREFALEGTSHFPEGYDQVYRIAGDNVEEENQLHLVGTSEVPDFAFHAGKKFGETELPYKMCAFSPCFRSEVGSWGKDVKGIKRVHQFEKLEMDVVCLPEQSEKIFHELLEVNEWFYQKLELPYRIVQKCSCDAGYAASHKQYDVEGWRPTEKEFMELGTDTNCTDYQARRLNIRYIDKNGKKRFAHTVNNTGFATSRTLIMILENYQQPDGSVIIPEVLQEYVGKKAIKPVDKP